MNSPLKYDIDGDDIVITGPATWFGGTDDPQDDGQTASGFSTRAHPECRACALPLDLGARLPATQGSGLPRFPWLTIVEVTAAGQGAAVVGSCSNGVPPISRSVLVSLIDVGPALNTHHVIDLTKPAFVALGGDLDKGTLWVTYRIIGGALFLPKLGAH